jgi:hypothetical protein
MGSMTPMNAANETTSAMDPRYELHAARDLTEVRVLLVEERRILFHHEPLTAVIYRRIRTACDADGTELEREVVVLARHVLSASAGALRIAALHDPILDAMEAEVVVEAAPRLVREARHGLRCLIGPERDRERAALRELDGRLGRAARCR